MKMKALDQLADLILKTIERFRIAKKGLAPNALAESVYKKLDPKNDAPFLVRFTSQCDLQDRCRSQLRVLLGKEEREAAKGDAQGSLLQDFYPIGKEGDREGVYLPRMKLSYDQRMQNVNRLRSTGEGFLAHAEQLEEETKELVAQGKLKKPKEIGLPNASTKHDDDRPIA